MDKLPVWRILNTGILFLKNDFTFFLQAAILPFTLLVLFRFLLLFWLDGQGYSPAMEGAVILYVNVMFEQLLPLPLWVVVYRRIILGPAAGEVGYLSHWQNKMAYLKYELLFIAMMLVPMMIGSYANYHLLQASQLAVEAQSTAFARYLPYLGLSAVLYMLVLVISMRLTLVLPAMAIGATAGLQESWRATKGHIWRLLSYIFFYILTVGMGNYFVRKLLNMPEDRDISGVLSLDMLYSAMLFIINLSMGCILTAALAHAFIFLVQQDDLGH